jgi:hypothetical protein
MRESPTNAGPPQRVAQLCEIGLIFPRLAFGEGAYDIG